MSHRGRESADEKLALALAGGCTVREAAKKARVSERTAFRRLEDQAFVQEVGRIRGEMMTRAIGRLAAGMVKAVDDLEKLTKARSEAVRLGAVKARIELPVRLRESAELEERIRKLEQAR